MFADDLDAFEIRKTNRLLLVDLRRLNDLLTIRFARSNRLVFTRVGDLNRFILFRVRNADFTHSLVVGDVAARLLNRFRRRFLTDRFDVARFVRDVRDVDVDQNQTEFAQFRLKGFLNLGEERFAVAVNFVNAHRRDDLTKLPEDDVFRLLGDRLLGHSEETNRRVLHKLGRGSNCDREDARNVDADVFHRESAAKGNLDLHRLKT